MTRALAVEASGNLWGSERALLDLLAAVSDVEIAVCCPPHVPLISELDKLHIRTFPFYVDRLHERPRWRRLQAAAGVLRACVKFRPDIIYLNQAGAYRVALLAARLLGLPMVAHVRIFEDADYLAKQNPSPRRLRGIIAISAAVEEEIRRFRRLDPIQLHRLYDAYAPSTLTLHRSQQERLCSRLACVGRLVPAKGQDVLVSALAILKEVEDGLECLFMGEGNADFISNLQAEALRANTGSLIRWLGFVGDVRSLLLTCSVLVCPSHREPLGRVIFEAWDAGAIPVVFAGSGGAAELVAAAKGGVLYDEQTPQSLANAVRSTLALDQEQRARLINSGRSWMFANCNPSAYGTALSAILGNACTAPLHP